MAIALLNLAARQNASASYGGSAAGSTSYGGSEAGGAQPSGAGGGDGGPDPTDEQNNQFPLNLWLILIVILSLLTLAHATIAGVRRLRMFRVLHHQLDTPQSENRPASAHTRFSAARFPVALVNAYRIVAFRWTFPFTNATFADAFVTLGYVGLVLLWTFVASQGASMRVWATRSADIAVSQVPLLPVLASKNNIISFFTGVSHEKMVVVHRAAGRAILLCLWLHGAGMYASGTSITPGPILVGAVALVALSLTFIMSVGPVRKFVYEFFFVSHILLVGVFLVGGWYHVNNFKADFAPWMWSGMILWAFDRVLRLVRMIYAARPGSSRGMSHATIELVSDDTVRIRMHRDISWNAGQHVFLTLPGVSLNPLEAHPFTIATIPDPPYVNPSDKTPSQLSFIVRTRKGFTERLRKKALEARHTGQHGVTAVIDGPYGRPPDLTTYSTAVLVAGGSGISYTISMLENLVQRRRLGVSACRRVVMVWAIRDETHIGWIYEQLLATLMHVPDNLSVSIRIYVTRSSSGLGSLPLASMFGQNEVAMGSYDKKNWTVKEKMTLSSMRYVHIEHGRPSLDSIIADEARSSLGSMSVDVCGPTTLVDKVRAATRASDIAGPAAIARGMPSITLHVEAFSM